MHSKANSIDMCNGPLFKNILKFSMPLMITSLLQQFYHLADVMVVGRYAGEAALAGVGTTGSLTNLILNLFLGLSVGVSVVIGKALGENNYKSTEQIVHTAILLSIVIGALVSFIGVFFAEPLLKMIDVPKTVMPQAKIYMQIIFAGKIPDLVYNFGSAILRAKGDTKNPLYIVTASGLINVGLNLFFVIGLDMQADGVAAATVISQGFNAVAIIVVLMKQQDALKLKLKMLRIDKKQFFNILKVGIPSGLQSTVFSISNVLVQSSVNSFGPAAIAGCSASSSIGSFYNVAINTFYQSSLSFVSQNMGAKKYDRIKKIIFYCALDVMIVGAIEALISIFAGEMLLDFFAPGNREAIKNGLIRLYIVGTTYGLLGLMNVMAGALRGMGYSFSNMIISIVGVCGIRIVWIFTVFKHIRTMECLFVSFPFSWIGTFLMNFMFFMYAMRKLKREKND